ncbi:MAG: hypothetical protein ABIZ81_02890 [Opitutaceae bacterium]
MNFRSLLAVAAALATAVLPSRAEMMLKGVMITNGEPLFSLYSVEEQTSKWIKLGQSFSGFKALSFDPTAEVLVLGQGDIRTNLRLQTATTKDASIEGKGRLNSLQGIELAYELARQGDAQIATLLKSYQSILSRTREVAIAAESLANTDKQPEANSALAFLSSRTAELRTELENVATAKAKALLAAPPKP